MTEDDIRNALVTHVPQDQRGHIPMLVRIIQDALTSKTNSIEISERADLTNDQQELLKSLVGKQITAPTALISFGEQSSVGDVTINDLAGRDMFKISISVSINNHYPNQIAPHASQSRQREELATSSNPLINEYQKRLRILELQSARMGRKCPVHILEEIKDIRSTIDKLQPK